MTAAHAGFFQVLRFADAQVSPRTCPQRGAEADMAVVSNADTADWQSAAIESIALRERPGWLAGPLGRSRFCATACYRRPNWNPILVPSFSVIR